MDIRQMISNIQNRGLQRVDMGMQMPQLPSWPQAMQREMPPPQAPQLPAAPSFDNVASGMNTQNQATPHVAAAPYQGTLNDQYNQSLGRQPRYVSPNPQSQALNDQYDRSLGYTGMQRKV